MCQNPTWRHHYIPEFYLKRWTDRNGQLVEFSKPFGAEVKPKRVYPRETGFTKRLYELEGFRPELANQLESRFFAPVDSRAADVLAKIEGGYWDFTNMERVAWGQFLLALVTRHPENVRATKERLYNQITNLSRLDERNWLKQRDKGDTRTALQALQEPKVRADINREAMRIVTEFSQNEKIGTHLINMKWGSRLLPYDLPALLTSDRPLQWFGALTHDNCHLIMPLGPKRIFWACNTMTMMATIRRVPPQQVVNFLNNAVTRRAVQYVYGLGDSSLPFVQQCMGVEPEEQPPDLFVKNHTTNLSGK